MINHEMEGNKVSRILAHSPVLNYTPKFEKTMEIHGPNARERMNSNIDNS